MGLRPTQISPLRFASVEMTNLRLARYSPHGAASARGASALGQTSLAIARTHIETPVLLHASSATWNIDSLATLD